MPTPGLASINPTIWGHHAKRGRWAARRRRRAAKCSTDVTIVLNGAAKDPSRRRPFSMYYDLATYRDAFAHFRDLGVRPHVMSWIRPDVPEWIEPMADALAELNEIAPFESSLLDAEQEWTRGWPAGRPQHKADRLEGWQVAGARAGVLLRERGIPYGVTDIGMVSPRIIRPLMRDALYGAPQIHEFPGRGGIRRPGEYVEWMDDHWPEWVPDGCQIRPHVAIYGGSQTAASLRESIEACISHGYRDISGWTSRRFAGWGLRRVLAAYKKQILDRQAWPMKLAA